MRRSFILAVAFLVFGCSTHAVVPSAFHGMQPDVIQKQPLDMGWVQLHLRSETRPIAPITVGNEVYFLNPLESQLDSVSMTLSVSISKCKLGGGSNGEYSLAYGQDGDYWVGAHDVITRCTPRGSVTDYSVVGNPGSIVAGPDEAMWFTVGGSAGRIGMDGTITTYPLSPDNLGQIAVGPDGNLWIAGMFAIYQLTPAGVSTSFTTTAESHYISPGPDRALYFDGVANGIGRITTEGSVSYITSPGYNGASEMFLGPSNALWTETADPNTGIEGIETYYPSTNTFGPFIAVPDTDGQKSEIAGMVGGPDKNIWVMSGPAPGTAGWIEVYARLAMSVTPSNLTLSPGTNGTLTVSEKAYNYRWTAISSSKDIATVVRASSDSFTVTGVSTGHCRVTITDGDRNSVPVQIVVQ
jgi:hypothetical protein